MKNQLKSDSQSVFVDHLLSGLAISQHETLQFAMPKLLSKPMRMSAAEEQMICDFPHAAGLLDQEGVLLTFNGALVELLQSLGCKADILHRPHKEWAPCLKGFYEFHADLDGFEGSRGHRFVVYLSGEEIAGLLNKNAEQDKLTPSEARTLIFIAQGQNLRQIAEQDGVAYETRRSQLKTIQGKLGTSKNTELVYRVNALVSSQLFASLFASIQSNQQPGSSREDVQLLLSHYGPAARLSQIEDPGFPDFSILTIGPVTGRPVLVFHSIFYPCFPLPRGVQGLYERGLRMIIPIRPGYCGVANTAPDTQEIRRRFMALVERYLREQGIERCQVLGLLRGAPWAAAFLQGTKLEIERAVFASPYMPGAHIAGDTVHGRMAMSLMDMATRFPASIRGFLQIAASMVKTPDTLMEGARRLYRQCPIDRAQFRQLETDAFLRDWLPLVGRANIAGITADIVSARDNWHESFHFDRAPVTVLTGADDPIIPREVNERFVNGLAQGRLAVLEDAAFLYYFTQPERILEALSAPGRLASLQMERQI